MYALISSASEIVDDLSHRIRYIVTVGTQSAGEPTEGLT